MGTVFNNVVNRCCPPVAAVLGCFQVALVWHIGATDGMGGLSRYLLIMLVASHSCAGYLKIERNTVCSGIAAKLAKRLPGIFR